VTSFEPLANLRSVGALVLWYNAELTSLEGLSSLTDAPSIDILGNSALPSLAGLDALARPDQMSIRDNAALESLDGLQALEEIGYLTVYENESLTSVHGLENLTRVGEYLHVSGPALVDVTALVSLTQVDGAFSINGSGLEDLTGLESLSSVGGLYIGDSGTGDWVNPSLRSLDGLEGLRTVTGDLVITHNPVLTAISALHGVTSVGGGRRGGVEHVVGGRRGEHAGVGDWEHWRVGHGGAQRVGDAGAPSSRLTRAPHLGRECTRGAVRARLVERGELVVRDWPARLEASVEGGPERERRVRGRGFDGAGRRQRRGAERPSQPVDHRCPHLGATRFRPAAASRALPLHPRGSDPHGAGPRWTWPFHRVTVTRPSASLSSDNAPS
jgi:hypothetical protein